MSDNVSIVKRTYECGKAGDFVGFFVDFAEKAVWNEMAGGPYGGIYTGTEDIKAHVFDPMNREWTPFACVPEEFFAIEDVVFMIGRYFGKNNATQKPFDVRVVHVWRLENGKIVSFEQFTDTFLIDNATH